VLTSAAAQPLLGPFPGVLALPPVAGAALILLRPAQGPAGQLLASKPMVWLGELSYSLYLWHWPVLALLRYYTGSPVLDMPFSLLFIVLTLLLATLSYYAVETPLRAHRTRLKQVLGYGLLTVAALATSPAMASINQALSPAPLPIEYQRYADPATICHGQIVGDCLKGDHQRQGSAGARRLPRRHAQSVLRSIGQGVGLQGPHHHRKQLRHHSGV